MRNNLAASFVATVVVTAVGGVALAEPPRPAATDGRGEVTTVGLASGLTVATGDCSTVPADSTVRLSAAGIQQFSQGKFGHPPACSSFVTDFKVDRSVSATSSNYFPSLVLDGWDSVREVQLNGSLGKYMYAASNVTEAQCKVYDHEILVYRKRAGETAFALLGGGRLEPQWNQAGLGWGPVCMLKPSPSFRMIPAVNAPDTPGVVDTYRVAIKVVGAPGQVVAAALHAQR